jgi:hypothetical protein
MKLGRNVVSQGTYVTMARHRRSGMKNGRTARKTFSTGSPEMLLTR